MDLKYVLVVCAIIFVSSKYVIKIKMYIYAYVILCRLNTRSGGSRGGGGSKKM